MDEETLEYFIKKVLLNPKISLSDESLQEILLNMLKVLIESHQAFKANYLFNTIKEKQSELKLEEIQVLLNSATSLVMISEQMKLFLDNIASLKGFEEIEEKISYDKIFTESIKQDKAEYLEALFKKKHSKQMCSLFNNNQVF